MKKKILVIGSGFNALATVFALKEKQYDCKVVFDRNLKGVMSSVQIENETFDLGYQFFDGLDYQTENFIRNMFNNDDLFDFKYGASSFSNNFLYKDHAIPYWPSYGNLFVLKAISFYLVKFIKSIFIKKKRKI